MDTLDGRQKQALHAALLSAFPRHAALERLVEFRLDAHLPVIAGDGPLADVAYRLIEWAEAEGRLEALVTGAREANPQNPHLIELERLLREPAAKQRPALVRAVTGARPGCTLVISLAVLAALSIPLVWRARPWFDAAYGGSPKQSATPSAASPGRRVEIEVAFRWRSHGEADGCRSDETWRRVLYSGESTAPWPPDSEASRELQLMSLRDDVGIEHAQVFTADGHVPEAVATGQRRGLVRKWRSPSAVDAPVRIAACLQSQSRAPRPALRVTTWTRAAQR